MEGPDYAYRLTIREATSDFRLKADPENPNIPRGGPTAMTVSVTARQGDEAPIAVEVSGLPPGVTASPATILPGEDSTVVVLTAASNAPMDAPPAPIVVTGHATINGHEITRIANKVDDKDPQLQLASITPPPDVVVTTDASQVSLEPGKEADFVIHDCRDYREIAYFVGIEPAFETYLGGRRVYSRHTEN